MSENLSVFLFDDFQVDPQLRRLFHHNQPVKLGTKDFDILLTLVQNSGKIVGKIELMNLIWQDQFVEENNLTVRISNIRKVLGESKGEYKFIETISGKGYRFIAPVKVLNQKNLSSESESRPVKSYRKQVENTNHQLLSIAVLPFASEGNKAGFEYLTEGITESIINSLSQLPRIKVLARSAFFRFEDQKKIDPLDIGYQLDVKNLVVGRVFFMEEKLALSFELVEAETGRQIWGANFNYQINENLITQEKIGKQIAAKLYQKLTSEERNRAAKRYRENKKAYQLYLKGRFFWNKRTKSGLLKGIEYFQEAINTDETFALAYTGIADCYNLLSSYGIVEPQEAIPEVKYAAEKALDIDFTLAEAHASLGHAKMSYDWDWKGAERELKAAINLNPDYTTAYHWYGSYLMLMGRFNESSRNYQMALDLDPLSIIFKVASGSNYFFSRQYAKAIECCREALELDENSFITHGVIGMSLTQIQSYEKAIFHLQKSSDLSKDPEALAMLGNASAVAGYKSKAKDILLRLQKFSEKQYIDPFNFAIVYAGLDEDKNALASLERAYQERSQMLSLLKVDPRFDRLLENPRFQNLLQRIF